jgi:hypothetical protein
MRPRPSVVLAVVFLGIADCAHAGGVNLSWDACTSEGGAQLATFACSTNSGYAVAWASFVLDASQGAFVGFEATLDISTDSDTLPDWWQLWNAGSCRSSALTVSCDFSSAPDSACSDFWLGQAQGGITAYHTFWTYPQVPDGSPNHAQIKLAEAVPFDSPLSLTAGTEYYAFRLSIANTHTAGSGACGGCDAPACITFSYLKAVQEDNTIEELTTPVTSNVVLWQTSTSCSGASAPQNITWGQIRTLLH